jgi:hypothetical protein
MRYLVILISLFLFSCNKETLDPSKLKRVVMYQVDYLTYAFQGGKEFSYFENDTSTVILPLSASYLSPSETDGRLTISYINDTIFDGFVGLNTPGKVEFPQNMDNQIHFFRNELPMDKPDNSRFQTVFYDLVSEDIPYDSIWKSIARLTKVEIYQSRNNTANIGLFLYRPSFDPLFQKDWKWFVILKN